MIYEVVATPRFKKDIKKLVKKYPSLKHEFGKLIDSLTQHPEQGIPLGNHCFKIRLAISSKGKGKSGGARVITCVQIMESSVYLLTIFDKSEKDSTSENELFMLLSQITSTM